MSGVLTRIGTGLLALALMPFAASAADYQEDWSWRMPGEYYRNLEFAARSGLGRATGAFSRACDAERNGARPYELVPLFRGAADEFRKLQIQSEGEGADENLLGYCVFMQAFSRMKARDRNEAIKLFTETIDLYADLTWVSFAARYWIAQTKLDMGDSKSGWKLFEELQDESDAAQHPLMGTVLDRLGWDRWGKFKEAEAQDYWQRGTAPCFWRNNRNHAQSSHSGLHLACVVRGDWAVFEDSIFSGVREEAHGRRADIVRDNANWVKGELGNGNSGIMRYFNGKYAKASDRASRLKKFLKDFLLWFGSKRFEFVEAKRAFEFDCLDVRMHYGYEGEGEILKRVKKLVDETMATGDDKLIAGRIDTFIGFYYDFRRYDEALAVAGRLKDKAASAMKRLGVCRTAARNGGGDNWWSMALMCVDEWLAARPGDKDRACEASLMRADICEEAKRWAPCASHLEEYLQRGPSDPGRVTGVKYRLAGLYRDRLGDARKALKIYMDLNDPPKSLWELVTTYRALGEKKNAEQVLDEIASMFKDQAPQAVWTLAQFCEQDGDRKRAIGFYRRLLSQPEWKTSAQSSWAHQALERLGERTGGAMTNEVR